MRSKTIFYHAGCPVCVSAEQMVADAIDPERFEIEVVHLGGSKERIAEAESNGVRSVPALVLEQGTFHINYRASLDDLKA